MTLAFISVYFFAGIKRVRANVSSESTKKPHALTQWSLFGSLFVPTSRGHTQIPIDST